MGGKQFYSLFSREEKTFQPDFDLEVRELMNKFNPGIEKVSNDFDPLKLESFLEALSDSLFMNLICFISIRLKFLVNSIS